MKAKVTLPIILIFCLSVMNVFAQTNRLSASGEGGFENGDDFVANGWTVVQGSANPWFVGNAPVPSAGNHCAFTGSSQSTWSGSAVVTVNHIYREISFGSETRLDISFKYKVINPDGGTDYLRVFLVPTSTVPVAGTELTTGQLGTNYGTASDWTTVSFSNIEAMSLGTSALLVFSWSTDDYTPLAALALDEVSVTSALPVGALGGIKTIKTSGGDYNSFTSAIEDLNANGVANGGVTFHVDAGFTSTETPPAITTTGYAMAPILFVKSGEGSNPLIVHAGNGTGNADAIIRINGGDYLLFEEIDVSDNPLTGNNTNRAEYGYFLSAQTNNGCQNNSIIGCTVTMNRENGNSRGIYSYSGNAVSLAGGNSYNKMYNNTIENAGSGIVLSGGYSDDQYFDRGNEIGGDNGKKTYIGADTPNDIGNIENYPRGISAYAQCNLRVFNCVVRNIYYPASGSTYYSLQGIYLDGINGNSVIFNNIVYGISNLTANNTSGAQGIYLSAKGLNSDIKVYNNIIYGLSSSYSGSSSNRILAGMYLTNGDYNSKTISVFNNSIRVDAGASVAYNSACLEIGSVSSLTQVRFSLKNNIFANYTGAQTSNKHYCVYSYYSSNLPGGAGSIINNNDYYIANAANGYIGYSGADKADLAAWQAATTGDLNSVVAEPPFLSPVDLHLTPGITPSLFESGAH